MQNKKRAQRGRAKLEQNSPRPYSNARKQEEGEYANFDFDFLFTSKLMRENTLPYQIWNLKWALGLR